MFVEIERFVSHGGSRPRVGRRILIAIISTTEPRESAGIVIMVAILRKEANDTSSISRLELPAPFLRSLDRVELCLELAVDDLGEPFDKALSALSSLAPAVNCAKEFLHGRLFSVIFYEALTAKVQVLVLKDQDPRRFP